MHIRNIDLNLLVVLHALFRHRNVSQAAIELGLSQSAVSHALSRLRIVFGDPLFVRISRGIAPTEFAKNIKPEIESWMSQTQMLTNRQSAFDPKTANGRITISSTDYFEVVVMPKLQKVISKEAPNLQISLRPTGSELPKRDLEEGRIDVAISGFYQNLPEGFFQSKFFSDDFSVAASKNLFSDVKLSREQYFSSRHALITLQGDFKDKGEHHINGIRINRKLVYGSYSFTGLAWLISETDLIVTAPTKLLEAYKKYFPIRLYPCPIELKKIEVRMIWHEQTHQEPLRMWFRNKLKEVMIES